MSLTTVAKVKEYAGISGSTYDTVLATLLLAVDDAIPNYCRTIIEASDVVEYLDGTGTRLLRLSNAPVNTIDRIATGPETVLQISNTSAAIDRATVQQTATSLVLTRYDGASSTSSTLLFATYTTIGTLAAAVTALANGWTGAVIGGHDDQATAFLPAFLRTLDASDEPAEIEMYLNSLSWSRYDGEAGQVYSRETIPGGVLNIECDYNAGYATIPDDIVTAACALVTALHKRRLVDTSLKKEKIGDYAYETHDIAKLGGSGIAANLDTICPEAAFLLAPYRRMAWS